MAKRGDRARKALVTGGVETLEKSDFQKNASVELSSQLKITLGIALAAIAMLVGTGGAVLPQIIRTANGLGLGPDRLMNCALLLNIALILFGWKRYRDLTVEVGHRREEEAKARQLAERDTLTSLLNRRSFEESAASLIATAQQDGKVIACLVADLDRFKQINDLHGHAVGDHVLKSFANHLSKTLPEKAVAARLGGDEFAFLLPFDAASPETVDQFAAALIDAAAIPVSVNGQPTSTTLSVGLARSDFSNNNGSDNAVNGLLHAADIAMYHAKRNGRNCHFWFAPSMEIELRTRRELEVEIGRGIELDEFIPYYEQQIDLKTGKLTGFEMLARWNSSAFGVVSPQVFIPIAEELGIIGEMSERLIAKALHDAAAWDPELTLSVNISPIQLRDPWFAQKLLKLLVEANFPPQRLEIEITESCLHENLGSVRTLLASLRNQGIRVSLDDFGTGYSSLGQLRELPFDRIKIDRSFVLALQEGDSAASIIKAITQLCDGLGLPITAEGIETEELLAELQKLGDYKGQGYLYGRPEPADMTLERLNALNMRQAEMPVRSAATRAPKAISEKRVATRR
jgi:diguanylate cyclase (GGDEF)-like protein